MVRIIVPITTRKHKSISTIKKIRATPLTFGNEKNGMMRLSMGSQSIGLSRLFLRTRDATRLFINSHCITEKNAR